MKKKPSKTEIIKIISKILKMSPKQLEKIDNYTKMKNWDSLKFISPFFLNFSKSLV